MDQIKINKFNFKLKLINFDIKIIKIQEFFLIKIKTIKIKIKIKNECMLISKFKKQQ